MKQSKLKVDKLPCKTCQKLKPMTEFYRDRASKRGFVYNCKTCHWAKKAIEYKKRKEIINKYVPDGRRKSNRIDLSILKGFKIGGRQIVPIETIRPLAKALVQYATSGHQTNWKELAEELNIKQNTCRLWGMELIKAGEEGMQLEEYWQTRKFMKKAKKFEKSDD